MRKALHEKMMMLALKKARLGVLKGQTPFGACIVKKGRVVACAHNGVWQTSDITAHAEICAIRLACKKLKTINLSDCIIYSTCEPCPMCFSACHWARIKEIIYGATIKDALKAGFNELCISTGSLKRQGKSRIKITKNICRKEARELFACGLSKKGYKAY